MKDRTHLCRNGNVTACFHHEADYHLQECLIEERRGGNLQLRDQDERKNLSTDLAFVLAYCPCSPESMATWSVEDLRSRSMGRPAC